MKKYPFLPFKYIDHDNLSNLVAKINENLDIEKRKFQLSNKLTNAAAGTLPPLMPNSVFQCSIPTAIITLVDSRLVHTRINNTTVTPEFKSLVYMRTKLVTMLVMFHTMLIIIPTKKKMAHL